MYFGASIFPHKFLFPVFPLFFLYFFPFFIASSFHANFARFAQEFHTKTMRREKNESASKDVKVEGENITFFPGMNTVL